MVVIAIIAILAGLLMPALAAARAKAREASCKSNARQSALILNLYSLDWEGHGPMRWFGYYSDIENSINPNDLIDYAGGAGGRLPYFCTEIAPFGTVDTVAYENKSQAVQQQLSISFSTNMHMLGASGKNFETYASKAVLMCGNGSGIRTSSSYYHVAFPHGINPVTNKLSGLGPYKGYCLNTNGPGTANWAAATGSVDTLKVNGRKQFMDDNMKTTKIIPGDIHRTSGTACAGHCYES